MLPLMILEIYICLSSSLSINKKHVLLFIHLLIINVTWVRRSSCYDKVLFVFLNPNNPFLAQVFIYCMGVLGTVLGAEDPTLFTDRGA